MNLNFRKATIEDAKQYFIWVNDVAVRKNAFNCEPIDWESHIEWFNKKIKVSQAYLFIFFCDDIPVGQVRLDLQKDVWHIDYSVDTKFRGKGIGTSMIKIIINKFPLFKIKAQVKEDNVGSLKVFQKVGFKIVNKLSVNGINTIELVK